MYGLIDPSQDRKTTTMTRMWYTIFELEDKDVSNNDLYTDWRQILCEVEAPNRFETRQEALDRFATLPGGQYVILEVFVHRNS